MTATRHQIVDDTGSDDEFHILVVEERGSVVRFLGETEVVVLLVEAHWVPKKKKITAMMQRRDIGALVQSWRGKINFPYLHFT